MNTNTVIEVGEEIFYFNMDDVYYVPCEVDEFFMPFSHICGNNSFVAIGTLPFTKLRARGAVIKQIKHLSGINTKWDRRKQ